MDLFGGGILPCLCGSGPLWKAPFIQPVGAAWAPPPQNAVTWELVRNAHSQAPPQTVSIKTSFPPPAIMCMCHIHTSASEKHHSRLPQGQRTDLELGVGRRGVSPGDKSVTLKGS